MARSPRSVKKDNQIHFFSQNSACDTLTPQQGVRKGEHKQSNMS
jgi:hypothetical protein